MDCHKDFIAFRTTCAGVGAVAPKSKLFFEDLPGISCAGLAAIEPGKYNSARVMAEEKLRVACEHVLSRAEEALEPYIKARIELEAGEIGSFIGGAYAAGSALQRGVRLKMEGGILMRMLIPAIFLQAEEAVADLEVLVIDGEEEHSFTTNIEAGELTVLDLHLEVKSKTVDVVIADDRFKPMVGSTSSTRYYTASCTKCTNTAKYQYLSGVGVSDGYEDEAAYGIAVQVIATCSIEPALCMMLQKLRWAVLYQWGVEVLEEHIATGRMNFLGIHGKEWAAEKLPEWQDKVSEHLKSAAPGLRTFVTKLTPQCVSCGTGITMGYAHP